MTEGEYERLKIGRWYVVDDGRHDPFVSQLVSLSKLHGQGYWFWFRDTNLATFTIEHLTMIETEPEDGRK